MWFTCATWYIENAAAPVGGFVENSLEDVEVTTEGVKNQDDDVAGNGVIKGPNPLVATEADADGRADVAGAAELAAAWVEGCELAGRCIVGYTLRATATRLVVSLV